MSATATVRPPEFDARLTAYLPMMRKVASYMVPHTEIEEFVQDSAVNALTDWHKYQPPADKPWYAFKAWVQWQMRKTLLIRAQKRATQKRTGKHVQADKILLATPARQAAIAEAAEVVRALTGTRGGDMLLRVAIGEEKKDVGASVGLSGERVRVLCNGALKRLADRGFNASA
jgi:hypothetical protein